MAGALAIERHLALLLEYDGTRYVGSQWQCNGPSIQEELERAIGAMTGLTTRIAFAGRTDAGVHAFGQVAVFATRATYRCSSFVGGINAHLPEAIAVRACAEVSGGFDPRRQALGRRYRYTIVNSATRSPLHMRRAWHVRMQLDEQRMQAAAALLIGEQDFAAFANVEASRTSTRRHLRLADVYRKGRLVTVEMEANAFLMHQVRRTVAALVEVGAGKRGIEEIAQGLAAARPGSFEHAAPACGLCLLSVRYEPPIFGQELSNEDL